MRRFFSVYLRKKSRSKSSSLSRLEVNALASVRAGSRVPAAPWRLLRVWGRPEHVPLSQALCPQTHVRGRKLCESGSGFPKIERYRWDLVIIGLVLGSQRGLNSAPSEFLGNFVPRSGQDLG